ncbi:MAG: dicarboxylate/amino acid:cation symporter [Xanthomonadaceae bacterium]|nr:dicarboxylate/amino acid:cation symporter [Xanthomonadaceae bacterium]
MFAATVAAALVFHMFVTISLILRVVGGVSPLRTLKAMAPALLTAFSTASSLATLPLTLRCVRENANVSQRTTSFVLPLGATVNMNGTALYECVAAMFIAQAYGLDLNFNVQFIIVLTALVTSIGVAGVPAASMVAIGIILTAIGLPLEALGVLFVFDRLLDMMRTTVNIYGDAACAIVVAKLEGEENLVPAVPITNQ